jgi:LPS export ABC transporter protein LptC
MRKQNLNIILNIVIIFMVTMFFSCNDSFKQVQKMGISENEPIGVAVNINLKYTDSGRVTATLLSPKMFDFSNRDFPYSEFPEGIILDIYDEDNKKSVVVSDYAIIYDNTNLIDLQGNVVITTADNRILKTEQLFYDQKKEWLFTNNPVTFTSEKDIINGNGFDSNSKFTNAEVLEVTGYVTVED